jgi:hypothetical protein
MALSYGTVNNSAKGSIDVVSTPAVLMAVSMAVNGNVIGTFGVLKIWRKQYVELSIKVHGIDVRVYGTV